ncbi:MOSC domain-containing protein [Salibacterium salarium]|uniref:MOSC domain-containing protein n=1 Tax=Salibacterium salarium TaxID=284579 RepID=A0A3R9P4I6_9BACI|nr:MOSC domain-containing protein [Salibacterium salarium]RSL30190.1 MOSC domain-containing protein [Salibacterium salarium]
MKQVNQIKHLAVGLPKQMEYQEDKQVRTGIQKEIIEEAFLSQSGFQEDDVADKKNHGGFDRAVCVYPHKHYRKWEQEFDTKLEKAAFGENLTVKDMWEGNVYIGDTYEIGEAVIQVTQGRIPCDTINKRTGISHLLQRIIETGYTGFLCRVMQSGKVREGDQLKIIDTNPHRVSVLYALQTYFHDPSNKEAIEKILAVEPLADSWRKKLENRLNKR